jgi:hypothetical protein
MKYTKSTAEVYLFEGLPHHGWAKFTVQDMGRRGRISIASDYGDWQNGWNACGQGFKQFLCDVGIDYAADKFGADRWFDHDATIKRFREDVLRSRRENAIDKERAKELWKEIGWCEEESAENGFTLILSSECGKLTRYYDHCPDLTYSIHPLFRRFWTEAWSLFKAELQREIAAGQAVTV